MVEITRPPEEAVVRSIVSAHLGLRPADVTPETEITVRVRLQTGDDDPMLRSLHIHFGTDFTPLTHRRVHWSTVLTLAPVAAAAERFVSRAVFKHFPPNPPYWSEYTAAAVVLALTWGLLALAAVLYMQSRPPGEERVKVGQIEAAIRRGRW
jgi:hypothetical protein